MIGGFYFGYWVFEMFDKITVVGFDLFGIVALDLSIFFPMKYLHFNIE